MTFYERGPEGKIVPVTGEVPEEAIRLIESMDDRAIVQRMTTGIAGDAFIYRYPIKTKTGTKEIIGISTDGAYELANMARNLETLPDFKVDKDTDPDYIYAGVRVRNYATNVTLLGVGRQCKFMVDSGNTPIRDRLNEHAFVSAISKAQRNGILHHTKQEVIAEIIDAWSKGGKSRQLRPPILEVEGTPPPAQAAQRMAPKPATPAPASTTPMIKPPTATATTLEIAQGQITEQQEKLKKLRMEVHNRFQTDLGIGVEKRKEMLKNRFGIESLTDLNEQQLNECKTWIEELIEQKTVTPPTKAPAVGDTRAQQAKELGFQDLSEQERLRGRLYTLLTASNQLGLKDEEAKQFIVDREYTSTITIPKERLLEMIKEVDELVKVKQAQVPGEF